MRFIILSGTEGARESTSLPVCCLLLNKLTDGHCLVIVDEKNVLSK